MTYRVLHFLSNFARNAKYSTVLSGHLPLLTLTSGIDLLNDDRTMMIKWRSFVTLGHCRATEITSLQSQKVSQNFCLLCEFRCHNDRLKLYDPPPEQRTALLGSPWTFRMPSAGSVCLLPMKAACTVLTLSPACYHSHTVSLQVRQNLNCALYFIFPNPGKWVVALRWPCPLLQAA